MDDLIRVRNETTEQECDFQDEAAAKNFEAAIADPAAWKRTGTGTGTAADADAVSHAPAAADTTAPAAPAAE